MPPLLDLFSSLSFTILAFLVAVIIIVTIHELGHYLVGRWCGIGARAFAVGFGPVLLCRTDRRGTEWRLCLIPLGGYVSFLGDIDIQEARCKEARYSGGSFEQAGLTRRLLTIAAGPAINMIFAIAIFFGIALHGGIPDDRIVVGNVVSLPGSYGDVNPGDEILEIGGIPFEKPMDLLLAMPRFGSFEDPVLTWKVRRGDDILDIPGPHPFPALVGGVLPSSPAERAGLIQGDVVLAIDGAAIHNFLTLRETIHDQNGGPLTLRIWRQGQEIDVTLSPRPQAMTSDSGGMEDRLMIGINAGMAFDFAMRRPGPVEAISIAAARTWNIVERSAVSLVAMARGAISTCAIRGPLTVAETSSFSAQLGIVSFITFIAVLSAAVGFMNLLPIGPLDGGQIVIQTWTALSRNPDGKTMVMAQNAIMFAGFLAVGLLMGLGIVNDFRCS